VNCGRGASGIVHGSVGITDHAMQSMAIRGHAHNRETAANAARPLSVRCRPRCDGGTFTGLSAATKRLERTTSPDSREASMDNGGSRNRQRGNTQPGDEQSGGWTRKQRELMDEKFCAAFESALRSAQESKTAAAATVRAERRLHLPLGSP